LIGPGLVHCTQNGAVIDEQRCIEVNYILVEEPIDDFRSEGRRCHARAHSECDSVIAVPPAQSLMVIVPSDSHLEIEAMIENRDIGFVHAGQEAQIKVDAFNFNRYGLIGGRITSVSPDAITRDKPGNKGKADQGLDAENDSREPSNQELVYAARVALDQMQMQIEDRVVNLSPGMAVTVEIKTGERHIISYLLSPLLKFKQEALRER
jgi:hemolysin D